MSPTVDSQFESMINNMPEKTGKSLGEWFAILKEANFAKHGEMLKLLKEEYGVTHGFTYTIAALYRQQAEGGAPAEDDLVSPELPGSAMRLSGWMNWLR